jgi:hypothetical protein
MRDRVRGVQLRPPPAAKEDVLLLILAIILFCIAIAGGVIVHPVVFILALVALAMFFSGRRTV